MSEMTTVSAIMLKISLNDNDNGKHSCNNMSHCHGAQFFTKLRELNRFNSKVTLAKLGGNIPVHVVYARNIPHLNNFIPHRCRQHRTVLTICGTLSTCTLTDCTSSFEPVSVAGLIADINLNLALLHYILLYCQFISRCRVTFHD